MLRKSWSVTTVSLLCVLCFILALLPGNSTASADMSQPYWSYASDGIDEIRGIQMSDDGRVLAFIDGEGTLIVLDIVEKESKWEFKPADGFDSNDPFKLSADGSTLVAVDELDTLYYFSVQEGNEPLWTHPSPGYLGMAISKNGSLLQVLNVGVVTTYDDEGMVSASPYKASLTYSSKIAMAIGTGLTVAYDGLFTYTYYPGNGYWSDYEETTGPELSKVMLADDGLTSMYMYDDGTVFVGKSNKGGGKVWTFPESVGYLEDMILSRDGSSIVCQRTDMTGTLVSFYDTAGEYLVWSVTFDAGGYIKLSGDGQTLFYSFYWSSLTRSYDKWGMDILSESGRGTGDVCISSYDGSTVALTDLFTVTVYNTPDVVVEEDDDDGQSDLIPLAGLAIGIVNLVLLVVIVLRKK